MWTLTIISVLLGAASAAAPTGAPVLAPLLAGAEAAAAKSPAVARSFGASVVGPSGSCRIPARGGTLINAPLDKGNPMASNIQPYAQPSTHTAHVDSATYIWQDLGLPNLEAQGGMSLSQTQQQQTQYDPSLATGTPDSVSADDEQAFQQAIQTALAYYQQHNTPGLQDIGDNAGAGSHSATVAAKLTAADALGINALNQSAQANSAPLDLQDGDVATNDASLKTLQGKGVADPVALAMQAGKPAQAAAAGPLTALQNALVLAPQQAATAKSPNALPSAIQAGLAAPVNIQPTSGGRKMLQDQAYPDCCNSYTVKAGDTLASIAAAYGQPDNGAKIMQAANGLSGDVAPDQTIMLPCGRLLTYISAYNVGLLTNVTTAG